MTKDLTVGNPGTVLWKFCLPLFGSVIFQQMYNISDSLIAGQFIGEAALAAVGNAYEVTLLFIAVSFGCNIGCSVITAQQFGARQYGEMKTAVYTSLIGSGVLCVLLMSLGFLGLDWILKLIQTPGDVFADCRDYLKIWWRKHPPTAFAAAVMSRSWALLMLYWTAISGKASARMHR